jgi:hypothetical protein
VTIRIPGFTGATGGETRDSEAAIPFTDGVAEGGLEDTGVGASSPFESALIVEVDDDRPNEEVKGARCVSFNLPVNILLVSFQDIVAVVKISRRKDQSPRCRNACAG